MHIKLNTRHDFGMSYIDRLQSYTNWCKTNIGERGVGWDYVTIFGESWEINNHQSIFAIKAIIIKDEQIATLFRLTFNV